MSATSNSSGWRFDKVLEAVGLAATADIGDTVAAAYRGRLVVDCMMQQADPAAAPTRDTLVELYADASQHLPAKVAEPEHYAALAEELGLRPGLTAQELARRRRAFALANHPDRAPPASRDQATRRMAIANILIDCALKECHTPA